MLEQRLKKRLKHLKKWAQRQNITCFRLYEKDIPEYPCVVDWYDGDVVVWIYRRKKDETAEDAEAHAEDIVAQIQWGLERNKKQIFVKERYRQKGEEGREQYEKFGSDQYYKIVQEQGLSFEVNLSDYLDTGLFLDHRPARTWVREQCKGLSVLNLFAYTGSFSVYALDGGASSVTTIDLSNTYGQWTEKNMEINGFLPTKNNLVIQADCLAWLKQAKQEENAYDLIICDPPTFSNSKKMTDASFVIDRDYPWLLADMIKILAPGGKILFSNNSRGFKLDETKLPSGFMARDVSKSSIPQDFRNERIHQAWWIHAVSH